MPVIGCQYKEKNGIAFKSRGSRERKKMECVSQLFGAVTKIPELINL